ncbi:MAG: oxidoreductase [Saprospiraceae bacterium]|nr:oxidoreductase [Saprospiraceae bacterium]
MKTALVLGATGLVGRQLIQQLLDHPGYDRVVALVRRPMDLAHPKLHTEIVDFDKPDAEKIRGDDMFCALGTTLKAAGSKEAQFRIDCEYPAAFAKMGKENGVRKFMLVSSVGSDAHSSNFYLRTKGDLEQRLQGLGFESLIIARPSFLLGNRQESRPGERAGIVLAQWLKPLIPKRYRGVQVSDVAKALIAAANDGGRGMRVMENETLS